MQDEGIRQFLASKGTILREHHTGNNKWDAGFGVASMSTLFGTKQPDGKHHRDNLIHLPSDQTENIKSLIEQLITWSAGTKNKQDGPMALWFAETQMRDYINQAGAYGSTFIKNPFATRFQNTQLEARASGQSHFEGASFGTRTYGQENTHRWFVGQVQRVPFLRCGSYLWPRRRARIRRRRGALTLGDGCARQS